MKETNKNFQDLKMEIETITKTQTEQILEVKNLEIKTRITDENLYQQNTKERRETGDTFLLYRCLPHKCESDCLRPHSSRMQL